MSLDSDASKSVPMLPFSDLPADHPPQEPSEMITDWLKQVGGKWRCEPDVSAR
jgi:hypothetical protein